MTYVCSAAKFCKNIPYFKSSVSCPIILRVAKSANIPSYVRNSADLT